MTPSDSFVPRVLCVGECMVELSLDALSAPPIGARVGFAGDTANTAVYLKRVAGAAAAVGYVTVVGEDELSRRMRAFLRDEGLDDALIGRHGSRLPGLYSIATDAHGERSFSYWRDRSAARTLFEPGADVRADDGSGHAELALDALGRADLVHLSGITLAVLSPPARERLCARLGRCRERGVRVSFDSNYRPALWEDAATASLWISRLWRLADIGLPSADDERALFGDASVEATVARLRGCGVRDGAVKDGVRGAVPIDAAATAPAFAALERVVDSTAAGDSFDAAFLAARLAGGSCSESIGAGHALAREVIGHRGAIVPRAVLAPSAALASAVPAAAMGNSGRDALRDPAIGAPDDMGDTRREESRTRSAPLRTTQAPDDGADDPEDDEPLDTDISRAMSRES